MAVSDMAPHYFFARNYVRMYDHDPDTVDPTVCSPDGGTTKRVIEAKNFYSFAFLAMTTVAASGEGISSIEIIASASEDMSSPEQIQIVVGDADAVGDTLIAECTVDMIAHVAATSGKALQYVALRLTCGHAGVEAAVVYIAHDAVHKYRDLTANVIS